MATIDKAPRYLVLLSTTYKMDMRLYWNTRELERSEVSRHIFDFFAVDRRLVLQIEVKANLGANALNGDGNHAWRDCAP